MSVTFFTPEGIPRDYRTVSERLPEFLDQYPLDQGYRIVREHEAFTQFRSDLQALWQACVQAGHKPADMGLGDPSAQHVVFRCSLVKDDKVVLNASALKQIHGPKDWESGETAAFQRLMAAAGLGGEVMDEDDRYDRVTSGLERPGPGESANATAGEAVVEPTVTTQTEAQSHPEPEPTPEEPSSEPEQQQEPESGEDADSSDQGAAVKASSLENGVRPQFLNQLRQMAALVGEEVPHVTTDEEAKAEMKRLKEKTRKVS